MKSARSAVAVIRHSETTRRSSLRNAASARSWSGHAASGLPPRRRARRDLAGTFGQDLVRERRRGQAAGVLPEAADAQRVAAEDRVRRIGLRLRLERRQHHIGIGRDIAFAAPASAERVEAEREIECQVAAGREARARRADDAAALAAGEGAGGRDDVRRVEPCAGGNDLRRERRDRPAQALEPSGMPGDEGPIVQALLEDHPDEAGENGGVFARHRLQMDMRALRRLGAAGIDDDQLHALAHGILQPPARVVVRSAVRLRDDRVRADDHPGVGGRETLRARDPVAMQGGGGVRGGLVDGGRREDHRRSERTEPGGRHDGAGGMGDDAGADIGGDRARAVALHDGLNAGGDFVHHGRRGDRPQTAALAAGEAAEQSLGVVVLLRQRAALRAGIALVEPGPGVALDLDRATVLDRHEDRAEGKTIPADAWNLHRHIGARLGRHGRPPGREGRPEGGRVSAPRKRTRSRTRMS